MYGNQKQLCAVTGRGDFHVLAVVTQAQAKEHLKRKFAVVSSDSQAGSSSCKKALATKGQGEAQSSEESEQKMSD